MARKRTKPTPLDNAPPQPASAPARSTDDRPKIVAKTKSTFDVLGRTEPTVREIRERAYYIYLARSGVNGDPESDWFQAERELREELRRTAPARRF